MTTVDLKEILLSGPANWNDWRARNSQARPSFARCSLYGANLEGADLTDLDFAYANLDSANLRGADLTHATSMMTFHDQRLTSKQWLP